MMKPTPRYIAFLVVLGAIVFLQPSGLIGQPKLKIIDGTKIDYGTIFSNEIMKREIKIKNEGTDTLTVTSVSSSCGCTVALVSNDHIPPQGSGKISVSFDPERFSGKVSKGISFETNDPKQHHAHIDFTVNISKIIELSNDYITFPNSRVDSIVQTDYTLKNLTDRPIKILSILSTSYLLSAESDKKVINPNEIATITCILRPRERGVIKGNIKIDTDNPNIAHISTRFFALVKPKPSSSSSNHN
ncbi:MAG: DUF1573 domain-containing protein [Bacteroidota bacterium]